MRLASTMEELARYGTVDLFVTTTFPDVSATSAPDYIDRIGYHCERLPNSSIISILSVFISNAKLETICSKRHAEISLHGFVEGYTYDLVWYVREATWARTHRVVPGPSVVDIDDLSEVILARWIAIKRNNQGERLTLLSKQRMLRDASWSRTLHRRVLKTATVSLVTSKEDLRRLNSPNLAVLENTYTPRTDSGVKQPAPTFDFRNGVAINLLFVGILLYPPNADAVNWFCNEILPIIRAKDSRVRLIVVGKISKDLAEALADRAGIVVLGEVQDLKPIYANADLVVVPLRVGGGTRIKILEAFYFGLPVISTSIGAEGISAGINDSMSIADDPDSFAQACLTHRALAGPWNQLNTAYRSSIAAKHHQNPNSLAIFEILQRCGIV